MIIDTSVIIAVLKEESDNAQWASQLSTSRVSRLSAASYLEAGIVADSERNPIVSARLDEFLATHRVTIEPVTEAQAKIARQAYRDYGRGSGHPAQLSFGDCFAYALAKDLAEPLLYKGDDFSHTDVRSALA